jgi:hypothetical protein
VTGRVRYSTLGLSQWHCTDRMLRLDSGAESGQLAQRRSNLGGDRTQELTCDRMRRGCVRSSVTYASVSIVGEHRETKC